MSYWLGLGASTEEAVRAARACGEVVKIGYHAVARPARHEYSYIMSPEAAARFASMALGPVRVDVEVVDRCEREKLEVMAIYGFKYEDLEVWPSHLEVWPSHLSRGRLWMIVNRRTWQVYRYFTM